MTTSDDFSALRDEFWQHYSAGRRQAALAVAERAWDGFPERRGYAWMFLAVAHCGLGSADGALEVLQRAESENHIWRLQLLRLPELDSLRADPRFDALTKRAQARVASRNFQARLLLAEPEPAATSPTLLLGLHGATSTADEYHRHWLPATRLGCIVASPQSSQPATESTFCWDDRSQVRRDLASLIDELPEHGEIMLTGFSQGALVAPGVRPETRLRDLALRWPRSKEPPSTGQSVFDIRAGRSAEGDAGDGSHEDQRSSWLFGRSPMLALTGDLLPAAGVIAVAPSFPPPERLPDSTSPLDIEIVYGTGDSWGRTVQATAEALRQQGHRVTVEELRGLGHDFPPDFAGRLPALLRRPREGVRAP